MIVFVYSVTVEKLHILPKGIFEYGAKLDLQQLEKLLMYLNVSKES